MSHKSFLLDPSWRLNHLYQIVDEKGEKIPFKLNRVQREFYYNLWYLNVILKARQLGLSTFILIFILDRCLFNPNTRAGVIAHTQEDAERLFKDKVKFAYDNLPHDLKAAIRARNDRARELVFANGSSIRVGTSMRSGTLNYLHVSELGKISAKYPDKAEEIKTGALNTVHENQFIFIESTAEGRKGLFFDLCQEALKIVEMNRSLAKTEFKFHFFPWWNDPRYFSESKSTVITEPENLYFEQLAQQGINLSDAQKAWYVLKWRQQKMGSTDKMKQEFPSTPKEAFETQIVGGYYGDQITQARSDGRIGKVNYEPAIPVNTFWDLGRNDTNCIWFHQRVGTQNRFIDYYENNGEALHHYAKVIQERGYVYGRHYLPHDVSIIDISREDNKSRADVLRDLGINPLDVVPRIQVIGEGIEMVRNVFPSCWFDEAKCEKGLNGLEHYRKEWDDRQQTYKDRPYHNWASNPADAFRQFAQGYHVHRQFNRRKRGSWRIV